MATGILRVNRDIILAMKRQQIKERQKTNPMESVLALAQMQANPRYVMNLVEDAERMTIFGQVTRTPNIYDPVAAALGMVREGADAIMFFTDHSIYPMDLEDMFMVARALKKVPVVYENYVVNDYHVVGIRVADASGVMLYASLLDPMILRTTATIAQRWRLALFLQTQNLSEIEYANTLSPHVICYGDNLSGNVERSLHEVLKVREEIPFHTKLMLTHTLQSMDEVEMVVDARLDAMILAPHLLQGDNARRVRQLVGKE